MQCKNKIISMFKVNFFYNPIINHYSNGEMSVYIYKSNGKKTNIDSIIYNRDYKRLMQLVTDYVNKKNNMVKSSFIDRLNALYFLYF